MPMRLGTPMPELSGATEWLNGSFQPEAYKGAPTLVHFWAVSCHICHETMPDLIRYRDEWVGQGLKVVGIHMPRQESDTDLEKVKQDIQTYGISHLVGIDNRHAVANAFQNEFVPAFFLFDQHGNLFFRAAGDKGFERLKPKLDSMMQEYLNSQKS
jgi:thiol-disulfide isomerase/thioredoxin